MKRFTILILVLGLMPALPLGNFDLAPQAEGRFFRGRTKVKVKMRARGGCCGRRVFKKKVVVRKRHGFHGGRNVIRKRTVIRHRGFGGRFVFRQRTVVRNRYPYYYPYYPGFNFNLAFSFGNSFPPPPVVAPPIAQPFAPAVNQQVFIQRQQQRVFF